MALDKVIFLDRDGVINHDSPEYIKNWDEYRFLPGSLEALAALTAAGYHLILITNQSIIGRGMVPPDTLEQIHRRLKAAVEAAGGRIFDIIFCPHHPDDGCACRKPRPGMIEQARARHGVNVSSAVMIGDNAKDVQCGFNAGCGATILVRTGSGVQAQKDLAGMGITPTAVAENLSDAAKMILDGSIKT